MNSPRLEVGVDEFTLVLQSPEKVDCREWLNRLDAMLEAFLERSKIEELFGPMRDAIKNLPAGYTNGLTYDDKPWYLVIAWHEDYMQMGICVKFSAYAYACYKAEFEKHYHMTFISDFLQMVQCEDIYTIRLSRIDFTADYFNYPDPLNPNGYLRPDLLYRQINDGSYVVRNAKGANSFKSKSAIDKDGAYSTFYLGSLKGLTFLRCYDKREEQMEKHGFRYDEALNCRSWIRFEAVFRHEYAHQITEQLLTVQNVAELQALIAKHISDRFQFYDTITDAELEITADLVSIANGAQVSALSSPNPRDNSLKQSVNSIRYNSGLYSTMYKVSAIWGSEGVKNLLEYLYTDYIENYEPEAGKKRDIKLWLKKHKDSLISLSFDEAVKGIVKPKP